MICGAILPDGISPMLKVYIRSQTDMVVGYIGEGSSGQLASMWQAPFESQSLGGVLGGISTAAGAAGDLAQIITGNTSKGLLNSTLVWEGQQPPEFNLVVDLMATTNAQIEVNAAITALLQMASPELEELTPGGRIPEAVTLNIGRNIQLAGVVIKDVSFMLDAPRTPEGYYTHNTVTLQCSGNGSLNRSNISSVFI
ncbi:hypothetical protein ACSI5N_25385 (plasmid) [Raoultella ornithinolytica]|uniref:hypothetical protein n=1 Tax=Raoultella ornithinolytica TaxID=54291 RepID=UPI00292A8C02|nr:hypothetical protein [Raoultella ornithinolytica]MDV1094959.1 hypothetical protein [Raoultella ornithinolytica]MDV1122697.1 hypothetical protein [Raoultella ornithinolytica]MDV1893212.1 hypothetical protein [Raoultella ornithinolytica]